MTDPVRENGALPRERLPRHVAIIMDGNGRWAEQRSLPRVLGHREGVKSIREIVTESVHLGIERLTLYAFSTDNWKRPRGEVAFLMRLLKHFLIHERGEIMDNGVRLTAIGRLDGLPKAVQRELAKTSEMSADNSGTTLCLALNYGGRAEILDAVKRVAEAVRRGELDPDQIDERRFRERLYDPQASDPDLLIRTGGEMRVSDFLLWQISYSELWITQRFWPEFRKEHLHEAFSAFMNRKRRFGGLNNSSGTPHPSSSAT
ncbi:MAG: isoprenyl transferase [Planctomycetota bacterium]